VPVTDDGHTHPDIDRTAEQRKAVVAQHKKNATSNQRRIERIQTEKYMKVLESNADMSLGVAIRALRARKNVKPNLDAAADERMAKYTEFGLPILWETSEKGWDMAMAQTRSLTHNIRRKTTTKQSDKITPDDELALAAIRERTADGRRKQLDERNIQSFLGFDANQTENIMKIVEDGLANGKTFDEIAASIRGDYNERYRDQAFTIARTETLTAVSSGLKANNDALNQVFSKVNKQWFHVGDSLTNPDARVPHAGFEQLGVVPSDFKWENETTGASLMFPRDPNAGARDVINCRCTMVSVIPDDATSNARTILEV
jgi:hypothetical protein